MKVDFDKEIHEGKKMLDYTQKQQLNQIYCRGASRKINRIIRIPEILIASLIVGGAVAGLLNGWLGLGGMSIFMPLLIWLSRHGFAPEQGVPLMTWIVANSVAVMLLSGIVSVLQYKKQGMIESSAISWTAPCAAGAAALGCMLALSSGAIGNADKIFAGYLIVIGLLVFINKNNEKVYSTPSVLTKSFVGTVCGMIAGFVGFNGNSLLIPAMKHAGLCSKSSIATNQVIGAIVSLSLLFVFFVYAELASKTLFNPLLIGILGVSSIVFSLLGTALKKSMSTMSVTLSLSICYVIAGGLLFFMR